MAQQSIEIRGAREHNLRDISLDIPRDKLVVITGLSGSGKSSLAFDTIYAEGQRRYVESLSSYARMFLGQMDKPDLDSIDGLSPAVSIDQKTTSRNPRSTVGTVTEIYDYLRLLFARVGVPHCPECGRPIARQTTDQVADKVLAHAQGRRALVLAPVVLGRKGEYTKLFDDLKREGFTRVRIDGEVRELEGQIKLAKTYKHSIEVVVDRIVVRENSLGRIAEWDSSCSPTETIRKARRNSCNTRWPWPARSMVIPSTTCSRGTSPSMPPMEPVPTVTVSAPSASSMPRP